MQTKSEPPDGSPTAAIGDVQFSVSKGAARRPDAAPRIPRREVNLFFERDGLLGGDGGLFKNYSSTLSLCFPHQQKLHFLYTNIRCVVSYNF